jgi:capsular polysaccharide biosynthesis protein
MVVFMASALNKSKMSLDLHIEIFEARGHIRDHIDLFRRARVIVGPHGAGMMNILWSSPGTHVVEIGYTTGMTLPEMYAEMSLHLEQRYWICKGHGDYSAPIHVDMDDFIYIFNQIIHEIEIESQPS